MPDLRKPVRQMEQRIGKVSREILRIEAHIRRGEQRAAEARISGVRDQLDSLVNQSDAPLQMTVLGAQLGLMSGKGSWLRGRLPTAVVCGLGGWMYGQSVVLSHQRDVRELAEHLDYLEEQLDTGDSVPSPGPADRAGNN